MASRQDFSLSTELTHPIFEVITIVFMSLIWALFVLSTKNYTHVDWYPWLVSSRSAMAVLGIILAIVITKKKLYHQNLASVYMTATVLVQSSHGFFEGSKSLEFHSFTGVLFILSALSFNGNFSSWIKYFLPIQLIALLGPIFTKEAHYWAGLSNTLDNFSLVISGLLIGITVAKLTSSRYEFAKKYLQKRYELLEVGTHLAHDMQAPIAALETYLDMDKNEFISEVLQRLKALNHKILNISRGNSEVEEEITLNQLFESILKEYKEIYPQLEITITSTDNFNLTAVKLSWEMLLINIIKNAIEESISKIAIEISSNMITISDNGKGFPEGILLNAGNSKLTIGKVNGNGIGLMQIRKTVIDSKLDIQFQNNNGAQIIISTI